MFIRPFDRLQKHHLLFLCLFILIINTVQISFADENAATKNPNQHVTTLDKVAVHASNNHIAEFTSQFVQEFQRQDFINKYSNLGDFLKRQNGVQIRDNGMGNPVAVSIRGSSHQQVSFIVDGFVVENSHFGGFDLNQVPLAHIESVRLSQAGGNSQTSQAIGGVIEITTRNFDQAKHSLNARLASFNTYSLGGSAYLFKAKPNQTNKHQVLISGQRLSSDNNFSYPVPQPLSNPNDFNRHEKIKSNQYLKEDVLIKGRVELSEKLKLNSQINWAQSNKQLPNYQRNSKTEAELKKKNASLLSQLSYQTQDLGIISSQLKWQKSDDQFLDPNSQIGLSSNDEKYTYRNMAFKQSYQLDKNNYQLSAIYQYKHDTFDESSLLVPAKFQCKDGQSNCDKISTRQSQSVNLSLVLRSEQQNHSLTNNLSLLSISSKQEAKYSSEQSQEKSDFLTGAISYQYDTSLFNIPLNLSLAIDKAVRVPSLYELYGNFGLLQSNPNLQPEESKSYSVGINSYLLNNTINISSTVFYRQLDNAIVPIYDSRGVGSYENTSSAQLLGWQNVINFQYDDLNLSAHHQWQDSITQSKIKSFKDKYLAGIFHSSFSAQLTYSFLSNYKFNYEYSLDTELYLDRSNLIKHQGRELSNIKLTVNFNQLNLNFSINNIFDKEYKNFTNRPGSGRNLSLSAHYTF